MQENRVKTSVVCVSVNNHVYVSKSCVNANHLHLHETNVNTCQIHLHGHV